MRKIYSTAKFCFDSFHLSRHTLFNYPAPFQWLADTNTTGDENSSQDIAAFIGNIDKHIKPLGAAALVVHHSGHGQKDRSRGSSSIRAAMDGEFAATGVLAKAYQPGRLAR